MRVTARRVPHVGWGFSNDCALKAHTCRTLQNRKSIRAMRKLVMNATAHHNRICYNAVRSVQKGCDRAHGEGA